MQRIGHVLFLFFLGILFMAHYSLEYPLEGVFIAVAACSLLCFLVLQRKRPLVNMSAPPTATAAPDSRVFRLRRAYLRIAIAGIVICLLAMFKNMYEDNSILMIGLPFMLVAQLWLLVAYWRARLVVKDNQLSFIHVIGARTIHISEVRRAHWHLDSYSISLKLVLKEGKESLWLMNFSPTDRRSLVRYFRDHLPIDIQVGWTDDIYRTVIQESGEGMMKSLPDRRSVEAWSKILGIGFVLPLVSGIALQIAAGQGADVKTWTGLIVLDWILGGLVTALVCWGFAPIWNWMLGDTDAYTVASTPPPAGFRE